MQATAAQQADLAQPVRDSQARKFGKVAFGATALFTAQLYLAPAAWFPATQPLRLALLLSIVALFSIAAHRLIAKKPLWMGWRSALLATYCCTALLSPMWSVAPDLSVLGAIEVAKHFLFFTAVVNAVNTPGRIRAALLLYAAAAIAPGWGTFWNWWTGELVVEGFRGRWYGIFGDPNHGCMALVGALPLLLHFAARGPGRWRRLIGIGGAAVVLMGVVATHSRGGTLGLVAAVAVWAMFSKRKAIALTFVIIAGTGFLLLAPSTFWQRNETISDFRVDESVRGRMQAWHVAGRILKERPFLGVGESAFLPAWKQYAAIDARISHPYVAHNLELEVLGQLGLVGLFGMMGFLVASLWSAWRARNGEMAHEARAVLAALVGYLVCQQFSGYSLSWFLYALCAFAACVDHWGGKRKADARLAVDYGSPAIAA